MLSYPGCRFFKIGVLPVEIKTRRDGLPVGTGKYEWIFGVEGLILFNDYEYPFDYRHPRLSGTETFTLEANYKDWETLTIFHKARSLKWEKIKAGWSKRHERGALLREAITIAEQQISLHCDWLRILQTLGEAWEKKVKPLKREKILFYNILFDKMTKRAEESLGGDLTSSGTKAMVHAIDDEILKEYESNGEESKTVLYTQMLKKTIKKSALRVPDIDKFQLQVETKLESDAARRTETALARAKLSKVTVYKPPHLREEESAMHVGGDAGMAMPMAKQDKYNLYNDIYGVGVGVGDWDWMPVSHANDIRGLNNYNYDTGNGYHGYSHDASVATSPQLFLGLGAVAVAVSLLFIFIICCMMTCVALFCCRVAYEWTRRRKHSMRLVENEQHEYHDEEYDV